MAFFATVIGLVSPARATTDTPLPNLGGRWILDESASDDPAEIMRPSTGSSGGSGYGGGGRGGGDNDREPSPQAREFMARTMERLRTLTIFHEEPELDYTDGLDISRLLYTDGRQCEVWTDQGLMHATANWESRRLSINWRGERGERTTRLELSEDGQRLTVLEQLRRGESGDAKTMRLAYKRAPEASKH